MARRLLLVGLFAYAKCEKHLDGFKIGTRLLAGSESGILRFVVFIKEAVEWTCLG